MEGVARESGKAGDVRQLGLIQLADGRDECSRFKLGFGAVTRLDQNTPECARFVVDRLDQLGAKSNMFAQLMLICHLAEVAEQRWLG